MKGQMLSYRVGCNVEIDITPFTPLVTQLYELMASIPKTGQFFLENGFNHTFTFKSSFLTYNLP